MSGVRAFHAHFPFVCFPRGRREFVLSRTGPKHFEKVWVLQPCFLSIDIILFRQNNQLYYVRISIDNLDGMNNGII